MRILISDSAKSVYHGMVGEIIKSLNSGHYVTVLVPDRFTMSVERGLLESLGKDASFLLEVQSFNYLARNELKKSPSRYLTPQGSVMLMADVIDKNKGDLLYYKKAAGKNGFAEEFSDAINVIRRSGIDAKTLDNAASELKNSTTGQKAHDLAVVYDKYIETLGETYSDASTRLEAFVDWLRKQEEQPNHDYYIMDYYDLSVTEINIINALDVISPNVCLGLTSGLDNPNKDIYSADRIIERIKETNSNVEVFSKEDKKLSPQQEVLSKFLFSYRMPKKKVENEGKYNLYKANSVYEELLRVAVDIKSQIMDNKARYYDFEVVCAQPEIYYPQLKAIFNRLNIPFFIDVKEPLMAQTQIRFLISMLEIVKSGYKREEVLSFVKNPLFVTYLRLRKAQIALEDGLEDEYEDELAEKLKPTDESEFIDHVSRFENYVLKYSINYSIFKSPFDITHKEDKYLSNKDYESAEFVRKELYEFISVFEQQDLTTAANLADAVKAKSLAIKDLWNYHKLVIAEIKDMDSYYSKVAEQVNKKIDLILDEIKDILKDTPKNVEGFIDMFKTMIEKMNIALVPTYRDCVYVGDLQSRYMGLGKIYIVGAAQGAFPSIHKSGIIISDSDEENFAHAGLIITPTLKDRNYTERLAALEILKKSRKETDISYSLSTPNGASKPSFVLLQMESMLTNDGNPIEEKAIELDDLASIDSAEEREKIEKVLFSTEGSKYYSTLRNLTSDRVDKKNAPIYGSAYKTLTDDEKDRIKSIYRYPTKVDGKKLLGVEDDASSSISKVETFYTCPYKYYMQYGLNIKERDTAKIKTTETGIVIHKVLQLFFIDVKDKKVNELNLESMIKKAFVGALDDMPRYKKMAQGEKKRLFANLEEECKVICSELYHNSTKSLFKPIMLEQKFGVPKDGKTLQGIEIQVDPDTKVIFKGQIDRVDKYNDKVYIMDYKTYKGANTDLTQLYFGKQIQLFIYMEALQHLDYKPVGAFYQPIYATYDSGEEVNRFKLKGVVHNTPGIQEAIDPDYELDKEKSFAAYKVKGKAKEIDPDVIMSPEDMNMLGRYSIDVARNGIDEIYAGFIEPQPFSGSCTFCPYADICSYEQENERAKATVHIDAYHKIYDVE